MLISRSWLQEYIDISDLSVATIAETLVDLGIEVEKVSVHAGLDHGIVVGEILEVVRHPNADSLNLCQVTIGGAAKQIVCGAHNVRKGLRVAVATLGSVLPGALTIKAAKIRGIASEGMICSVRELNLGDDHDGIWELDASWELGAPVSRLQGCDDTVFELSITPNRGDCLSYLGIARDLAARLGRPLQRPEVAELPSTGIRCKDTLRIEVDPDVGCARFCAFTVSGAAARPSPEWLQKRLLVSGLRPINMIVDVTNYCMLELGQPSHAYDRRFIKGGVLRVHGITREEKVSLLDGRQVSAMREDIVISDAAQVLGFAGVMGGAVAEIRDDSSELVIEIAHFFPRSIRKTSRRLGITSDASMRFERGIDISSSDFALRRIAALLQRCAQEIGLEGLQCSEDFLEYYPEPACERKIALRLPRLRQLLGMWDLSIDTCVDALAGLEITLLDKTDERMLFAVPHFRHDLHREVDLIEEVARMIGFSAIPYQLPRMMIQANYEDPLVQFSEKLREKVASLGMSEAINFPFIGAEDLDNLQLSAAHDLRKVVVLANPLSADISFMQSNTLPNLLKALARNRRYGQKGARLFECARGYSAEGEVIRETALLGGILDAQFVAKGWQDEARTADFFHAKGLLSSLCSFLGRKELSWQPADAKLYPWLHPSASALISCEGQHLGWLGELHPQVAIAFDLGNEVPVVFELDMQKLYRAFADTSGATYALARRFPPVVRDFAFLVNSSLTYQELSDTIMRNPERQYLHEVSLFDLYVGAGIPEGKKSMALSFAFAAADKTLTDQEVDREATSVLQWLEKNLGVSVRG
jgi:phenylalanyl-tRNA synthetase beta chain